MKRYIYSLGFFLSILIVSNVNGAFDYDSEEVFKKTPKPTIKNQGHRSARNPRSVLEEALANVENLAKKGFLKHVTKSKEIEWKSIADDDPTSFGLGFIAPINQEGIAIKPKPVIVTSSSTAAILPDSYDVRSYLHSDSSKWEKFWPVQNQGVHNSCVSNAITAAAEFDWLVWNFEVYMAEKAKKESEGISVAPFDTAKFIVPFSRLFLYYNARGGAANDNGISVTAGIGAFTGDKPLQPAHYTTLPLYRKGCCKETVWPYEKNYTEEPDDSAYADAFGYQVHASANSNISFTKIDDTGTSYDTDKLNAIKNSLYIAKRPVPFGLFFMGYDAVNNFRSLNGSNSTIALQPTPCSEYSGLKPGHSMLIVGYNDATKLFTLRNSYGNLWGNQGYCYAPYDLILSDWVQDLWSMKRIKK